MAKKKPSAGPAQLPSDFTGAVTVKPVLRRNPRAPIYYTPVVDIRVTDRDVRVLSFIVPPADADEIVVEGGEYQLPILSQCELVLPAGTVEPVIQALTAAHQRLLEKLEAQQSEE